MLFQLGRSLGESGLVLSAANHYDELHRTAVEYLGVEHPATLLARGNASRWRAEIVDSAELFAESVRLLSVQTRVLGPEHPITLITRNNLAGRMGAVGDVARAVAEYDDLLAIRLRTQGPDHPDTLSIRSNWLYWRATTGEPVGPELESLLADSLRVL